MNQQSLSTISLSTVRQLQLSTGIDRSPKPASTLSQSRGFKSPVPKSAQQPAVRVAVRANKITNLDAVVKQPQQGRIDVFLCNV